MRDIAYEMLCISANSDKWKNFLQKEFFLQPFASVKGINGRSVKVYREIAVHREEMMEQGVRRMTLRDGRKKG